MISYFNPIWYGEKWKIYNSWSGRHCFIHDDYDLDDDRHGFGVSLADCIEQIKEYEEEHA